MENAIIIHGCSSSPNEGMEFDPKHWISWIREALIARGISATVPQMPKSWAPNYEEWKAEFEKADINKETTLIGHSCGCAFLVRWLGDSKQEVDKLVLVAPWKIGTSSEAKRKFYDYAIDETIKSRVNKIIMFTADNEEENGKKSLQMFHAALGGKIIELSGRGHYAGDDDARTEAFPELLAEIAG